MFPLFSTLDLPSRSPAPVPANARRLSRRRWLWVVGSAPAGALALAGCGALAGVSGDEAALTAEGLPRYAYRTEAALASYRFAVAEPALLAQLPCYCGCGKLPGFENLRDCFVNGAGQFNAHGSNCQTCTDEALDAKRMLGERRAVVEIRRAIDTAYQGRGTPTNTPPVA